MSLIRGEEAIRWLLDGGYLECPKCEARYSVESELALREGYGEPTCLECRCQGFIPRGGRPSKVMDRFPDSFGSSFTAVPDALWEYGSAVGLRPAARLLVIAMCRFRWREGQRVFPSVDRLAQMTGLGPATVKRHLSELHERGLIDREPRHRGGAGRWRSNDYDLEPLWRAIDAEIEGPDASDGGSK